MIAALDSSAAQPTLAQARAAKQAGYLAWGGYLATRSNVALYAPWSRAAFQNVQQAGLRALAFCSGRDDPVALKTLAAEWDVLLILDVEDGIRGDGPWVQAFLDASGAGLYGSGSAHFHVGGRHAPFNIIAGYYGYDPRRYWPLWLPTPDGHGGLGWQWQGTHSELGLSVDSLWLSDQFAPAASSPVVVPPPLPGGSSDMSLALAPHPTDPLRVDVVVIGTDGGVWHQTASPFWSLAAGAWESLGGGSDTRGVALSWQGPDHLLVMRLDAAGGLHYCGWGSTTGWGDWVLDVGQALVPAWLHELLPGPPGPIGPAGPALDTSTFALRREVAKHTHPLTGVTGAPG